VITDLLAEQYVLGACLARGELAAELLTIAEPKMFDQTGHATIAAVIRALAAAGTAVEPTTVLQRLLDNGEAARVGGGPYLLELIQRCPLPMAEVSRPQAERVRDAWFRRAVHVEAVRLAQRAENPVTDTDDLIRHLAAVMDSVDQLGPREPYRPPTVDDLMRRDPVPDWLVPGLLERMERVMITGTEGLGKSEAAAQVAVCLAAGVHPFTLAETEPIRVLVVDLENGWGNLRRRYGRILAAVELVTGEAMDRSRLMVESRDAGLDLTRVDDQRWLDGAITGGLPDVVCIGPLYKMHRSKMEDEQAARSLTAFLDDMRTRHGTAFVIEAHAGHANDGGGKRLLRPRGSSLFLGWPNVGIGMRPHPDCEDPERPERVLLGSWRGARDERDWPRELRRGHNGQLPWVPVSASDRASYAARRLSGGAA
jgi:replicative DNA helicase